MSDKPEHSPGPWKLNGKYISKDRDTIALCSSGGVYDEANARLIVTAPELLEFVRLYLDSESTTDALDKMAKKLITKATSTP